MNHMISEDAKLVGSSEAVLANADAAEERDGANASAWADTLAAAPAIDLRDLLDDEAESHQMEQDDQDMDAARLSDDEGDNDDAHPAPAEPPVYLAPDMYTDLPVNDIPLGKFAPIKCNTPD